MTAGPRSGPHDGQGPAPAAPAPAAKADAMDALQARLDSLQAQLASAGRDQDPRVGPQPDQAESGGSPRVRFDAAMSDDLLRAAIVKSSLRAWTSAPSPRPTSRRYDSAIEARATRDEQVRQVVKSTTTPTPPKRIDEALKAKRDAWQRPIPALRPRPVSK